MHLLATEREPVDVIVQVCVSCSFKMLLKSPLLSITVLQSWQAGVGTDAHTDIHISAPPLVQELRQNPFQLKIMSSP